MPDKIYERKDIFKRELIHEEGHFDDILIVGNEYVVCVANTSPHKSYNIIITKVNNPFLECLNCNKGMRKFTVNIRNLDFTYIMYVQKIPARHFETMRLLYG